MDYGDMVLRPVGPATESKPKCAAKQEQQSQVQTPEFPAKKRKCRDAYCWVLFFLFYGGLIFWFVWSKQWRFYERVFDLMKPGDDFRRLCGDSEQRDKRAADFTKFLTEISDIKQICRFFKDVKNLDNMPQDCEKLSGLESRAMFKAVVQSSLFEDVALLTASYGVGDRSFCVFKAEIQAVEGKSAACNTVKESEFVCSQEYHLFLRDAVPDLDAQLAAGPESVNAFAKIRRSFFAAPEIAALNAIIERSGHDFIKKFCAKIPLGASEPRNDHVHNPFTQLFGYDSCIENPAAGNGLVDQSIAYVTSFFEQLLINMVYEIKIQWPWIVAGVCSSLVVAALYLLIIQFFVKFMVWVIIVGVILLLGGAGGYLLYMGYKLLNMNDVWLEFFGYINEQYKSQANLYLGFGYTIIVIDAILLLLLFIFCRAINIACEVIKLAVSSLKQLWFVFFLPIIFIILMVFHCAWTGIIAYFFYLGGDYDEQANMFNFVNLEYDSENFLVSKTDHVNFTIFVFMIFGVIWGVFFVYAWLEFTISHIVVQWYFNPNRDKHHFCDAACNAFKAFIKSSGTILFASFITSLVVLARWLLEYFMKRVMQTPGAKQNKLLTTLHKCGAYCLRCLQKCVEFINRNAQIYACISGEGYCKSAFKAIKLMFSEVRATIALQGLSFLILFLGKVLVCSIATVITYFLTSSFSKLKYAVITPCVVTAVGSFLVSYFILEIVELLIDTVYFCFLYEEDVLSRDREKGAKCYAPPGLAALLD